MGVPGYFARAARAVPSAVSPRRPPINRLFLDFNAAVHRGVPGAAGEAEVLERACGALGDIVRAASPSSLVYVALDGVAPLAKVAQQRSRRYMSMKMTRFLGDAPAFDRACITPGTAFMDRLGARLADAARDLAADLGLRVIVSAADAPGEGEHKIAAFIRANPPPPGAPPAHDCVYGLDADLIIIALAMRAASGRAPAVMREADGDAAPAGADQAYVYVDVDAVARQIAGPGPGAEARIMNHVVASFFAGNDFLPQLSCFGVKQGTVERICEAAAAPLCTPDGLVDWQAVADAIEPLAAAEDDDCARADAAFWAAPVPRPPAPGQRQLEHKQKAWDALPAALKPHAYRQIRPGTPGWRSRYYAVLLGTQSVAPVVADFAAGVQWTLDYYLGRHAPPPGRTPAWVYPHSYGPTALDLYNHARAGDCAAAARALSIAPLYDFHAARALLMVTPPDSAAALPPGLRRAQEDVRLGAAHLFPSDFEVDCYLRRWAHECRARLPPVDPGALGDVAP